MKRLITYNDNTYMPLWQTDLKFIQDNLVQVISEMAKMFAAGRDMFVVSGCELTKVNNQYHVTPGIVMIDNELLYVPQQSISSLGAFNPYVQKESVFNPNGEKQFLVGQLTEYRNTWDDNYGILKVQYDRERLPGKLYLGNAKTIYQIIDEQINEDSGWIDLPLINGWKWDGNKVQYRIINKQVFLQGDILDDGSVSNAKFADIGQEYSSAIPTTMLCSNGEYVTINNGGLYARNWSEDPLLLSGLSWLIG